MSGAIIFIHEDLKITEFQEEVLVGILSVISLLGSLGGGRASDALGRKWTMGIAATVFKIGALIMTLAPNFQISPAVSRGSFTSFPEIFINLGILLGYVSNYAFSDFPAHINWRIMIAVGILPSVFIAFALCIIPESPRWLVMQNRIDEARSVLLKTIDVEAEVEERLSEILKAAGIGIENQEEKAVWRELLSPSPSLRRILITGFGIQCFHQITGMDATVYYSPEILQTAVSVGFVYKLVPKTKGKSLEQIELLFQKDRNWQDEEVEMSNTQHLVQ
ncbi:hypothetical protein E3N88_31266 [Mikania micrantha]|uniref:Major facilitator superfamily (MFS) profile domain-containing protein n=1 Tax=Mikania micrantha TaxID=192012 RepID=A0A5N6MPS2_9ASTR|nr:hypothetical protein E3N88_31266 [Mikania micrantha]